MTHGVVAPRQISLSPILMLLPHIATPVMSAAPVCSFDSQQNTSATPSSKNSQNFWEMGGNTKSTVRRKKSEKGHPNLFTRVTTQPNSKNYSSLTCAC